MKLTIEPEQIQAAWHTIVTSLDLLMKGEEPKGLDGIDWQAQLGQAMSVHLEVLKFITALEGKEPCDCEDPVEVSK